MKRKSYEKMQCPVAQTLECVGEWWSILILRDAMLGVVRFDDFVSGLGISPGILSRRLKSLVEAGFLAKVLYSDAPPRTEYVLTARGRAFEPVILYLYAFGNNELVKGKPAANVVDRSTNKVAMPKVIDQVSGRELSWADFTVIAGPSANTATKAKLAKVNA